MWRWKYDAILSSPVPPFPFRSPPLSLAKLNSKQGHKEISPPVSALSVTQSEIIFIPWQWEHILLSLLLLFLLSQHNLFSAYAQQLEDMIAEKQEALEALREKTRAFR